MADQSINRAKGNPEADDETAQGYSGTGQAKHPFDTSGMNWLPEPDEDDPPYRDWWVAGDKRNGE